MKQDFLIGIGVGLVLMMVTIITCFAIEATLNLMHGVIK